MTVRLALGLLLVASAMAGCGGPCGADVYLVAHEPGSFTALASAGVPGLVPTPPTGSQVTDLMVDGVPMGPGKAALSFVSVSGPDYNIILNGDLSAWFPLGTNASAVAATVRPVLENATALDASGVDDWIAALLAHPLPRDYAAHRSNLALDADRLAAHLGPLRATVPPPTEGQINGLAGQGTYGKRATLDHGPWHVEFDLAAQNLSPAPGSSLRFQVSAADWEFAQVSGAHSTSKARALAELHEAFAARGLPDPGFTQEQVWPMTWCS